MGPYLSIGTVFFSQYPNSPKLKKKKKPELKTEPMKKIKKKRKERKNRTANPEKKKSQNGQKLRLVLFVGSSCVFNYKNVIELWK